MGAHRGDVSWCTAPTSPGAAWGRQVLAMTAYAALPSMAPFSKTTSRSADKKCCRLFTTVVPLLHAIDLELLTL
jgi:hypothetical protein